MPDDGTSSLPSFSLGDSKEKEVEGATVVVGF